MWSSREWETLLTRLRSGRKEAGEFEGSPRKCGILRASFARNHEKSISPKKDCLVCMSLNWNRFRAARRSGDCVYGGKRGMNEKDKKGEERWRNKNTPIFLFLLMPQNSRASWRQSCWMWLNCWRPPFTSSWIGGHLWGKDCSLLWTVLGGQALF